MTGPYKNDYTPIAKHIQNRYNDIDNKPPHREDFVKDYWDRQTALISHVKKNCMLCGKEIDIDIYCRDCTPKIMKYKQHLGWA